MEDKDAVSCCLWRTDRREGAVFILVAEGGSLLPDEQLMILVKLKNADYLIAIALSLDSLY